MLPVVWAWSPTLLLLPCLVLLVPFCRLPRTLPFSSLSALLCGHLPMCLPDRATALLSQCVCMVHPPQARGGFGVLAVQIPNHRSSRPLLRHPVLLSSSRDSRKGAFSWGGGFGLHDWSTCCLGAKDVMYPPCGYVRCRGDFRRVGDYVEFVYYGLFCGRAFGRGRCCTGVRWW